MGFHVRLVDRHRYDDVVRHLEAARQGDAAALRALVARCRASLSAGELLRWNGAGAWPATLEAWGRDLDRALGLPPREGAELVAGSAVALCAMPGFQLSVHGVPERSPDLVPLGDDDGGLYGALADGDPWFDALFGERFPNDQAPYRYGPSMIVLGRADLPRLQEALEKVVKAETCPPFAGEALRALRTLVARAMADERYALAVSEA